MSGNLVDHRIGSDHYRRQVPPEPVVPAAAGEPGAPFNSGESLLHRSDGAIIVAAV